MSSVWHEVIKASHPYFAPQDCVRLCTCSKQVRQLLVEQLTAGNRCQARQWLLAAVQQAASCRFGKSSPAGDIWQQLATSAGVTAEEARSFQQSSRLARWLFRTAAIPPELLAQDSMQYLSIPNVPIGLCEWLVAAGVRVSYQRLVSAARSHVEGLQHWVQACRIMGVATDLCPSAAAACCSALQGPDDYDAILSSVTAENLVGHLHLAINALTGTSNTPALAAATSLRRLLDWSLQKDLRQQLKTEEALQLLESVVYVLATRLSEPWHLHQIFNINQIVGLFTRMLGSASNHERRVLDAVKRILLVAVQQGLHPQHMYELLRMPVLQQLSSDDVAELLAAGLQSAGAEFREPAVSLLRMLYYLPAAQHMSSDLCAQVYTAVLDLGADAFAVSRIRYIADRLYLFKFMQHLPGVQGFSSSHVVQLLRYMLRVSSSRGWADTTVLDVAGVLCGLPAAASIELAELQELCQQAAEAGLEHIVPKVLLQLPAAASLTMAARDALATGLLCST